MEHDEMMKRLQDRDESVIAALDAAYGRLCIRVARNILGSDEDAEECKNDALMKIWCTIPPAAPVSLKSYAAMTARCAALNRYEAAHAKKRGEVMPLDELADICAGGDIAEAVEAKELGEAIGRSALALAAITDPALALAFVKALNQPAAHKEILESLEKRTKRIQQRQKEAKAHKKNVRFGKKK